jgi:hypothetical protein
MKITSIPKISILLINARLCRLSFQSDFSLPAVFNLLSPMARAAQYLNAPPANCSVHFPLMLLTLLGLSFSISTRQTQIVNCLRQQIGKPWVWGATGPDSLDCFGLSQYCHRQAGVTIPRTAALQHSGAMLSFCSSAEPGDLIFFKQPDETSVSHVATFTTSTSVVQGSNPETPINEYTNILANTYWGPRVVSCGRYWSSYIAGANGTEAEAGDGAAGAGAGGKTLPIVAGVVGAVVIAAVGIAVAVLRGRRRKETKREAISASLIA